MSAAKEEQETTINTMRNSDVMEIYTSDTTMMTRLDKLATDDSAPSWKLVEEIHTQNGDLVAKRYQANKKMLMFRKAPIVRNLTEAQKEILRARLKAIRN